MKKILKKSIFILIGFSLTAHAEYRAQIPLENYSINIKDANIVGNVSFDKNVINRGESATLTWNYKYVDSINIEGLGKYNANGSLTINPNTTSSYTITANNDSDNISETVTLTVIQPNPKITFISDKYRIGYGTSAQLDWDVLDVVSVDINNGVGNSLSTKGHYSVSPINTTTYTLTANGYEGVKDTSDLTITVVPNSIVSNFNSDKTKVSVGDSVLFSWNVNDTEGLELVPYGTIDKSRTNQSVIQNTVGDVSYTLNTTSLSGVTNQSNTIVIHTYGNPNIADYKVNNAKTINVEANDPLVFTWNGNNIATYTLDGNIVSGLTKTLNASTSEGVKTYTLIAENEAGKSVSDNVSVNVVKAGLISALNAPTAVYINEPFNITWSSSNLKDLKLSSTTGSGLTEVALSGSGYSVTPTTNGNYTYTLKGTNDANKETTKTVSVEVENSPTYSSFTVNGVTAVTVAPSAALNFVGSGFSAGATLQGRNSANTADSTLPTNASSAVGTTTYYAAATKNLNGITKYSGLQTVNVTVAAAKECLYNGVSNYSNMNVLTTWVWNNVNVGKTGRDVRTLTAGGYTYTQGALKSSAYDSNTRVQQYVYEICRTGI